MINLITKIIESKANNCPKQRFALLVEILDESKKPFAEVKQELNQLVKDGILIHGRTINDIYFKFVP